MEPTLNYLYIEIIEMLLNVLIWKGIWDMLERGIMDLFASETITYWFTIKLTLVVGYFLFFLTFFVHVFIVEEIKRRNRSLKLIAFKSNLLNAFYLVCFLSLVALWRTFFSGFDHFVLKHVKRDYFILGSHFLIFFLMYLVGLGPALNGPASFDPDDYSINQELEQYFDESHDLIKNSYFRKS